MVFPKKRHGKPNGKEFQIKNESKKGLSKFVKQNKK